MDSSPTSHFFPYVFSFSQMGSCDRKRRLYSVKQTSEPQSARAADGPWDEGLKDSSWQEELSRRPAHDESFVASGSCSFVVWLIEEERQELTTDLKSISSSNRIEIFPKFRWVLMVKFSDLHMTADSCIMHCLDLTYIWIPNGPYSS